MTQKVFPMLKSHFSVGKSILTLDEPGTEVVGGPDSIFSLAKARPDDRFFVVEDSISGVMQALTVASKTKTKMTYGLRFTYLDDASDKSEASLKKESKIVLLMKNSNAYTDLIKLSTLASKDGFYYLPRLDAKMLKKIGTSNLVLVVPFYDSYLFRNNLETASVVPSFLGEFPNVYFSIEDNDLPFDYLTECLVRDAVFNLSNAQVIYTQSIFYAKKKDFLSYLTFRCIHNRTSLEKPNLEHMSSDSFCYENYLLKTNEHTQYAV